MLKKLLSALLVLVVLIGAGGYFLSSNLDSLVRKAVETYGSAATLTPVKLVGVRLSLSSGEAVIEGLSVGSPQGFTGDKSFYVGRVSAKIDVNSIKGSGPIVIDHVVIDEPQILYEVNAEGQNNLKTIAGNAQNYAASFSSKEATTKNSGSNSPDSSGRKIMIRKLVVQAGKVSVLHPMMQAEPIVLDIPSIQMTDLGKGDGGLSGAQLAQKLILVISDKATQIAAADLAKNMTSRIGKIVPEAADNAVGAASNTIMNLMGK